MTFFLPPQYQRARNTAAPDGAQGVQGKIGPAGADGVDGVDGAPGPPGIVADFTCPAGEFLAGVSGGLPICAAPESCDHPGGGCTVFVTSTTHDGDLNDEGPSGLAGGDAICNARAQAAGLPGTFVAWLSTSTGDAKDRITDVRYVRVDGTQVADDKADLLDGTLDAPINRDEADNEPTGTIFVWTGTIFDGTRDGSAHCNDWTDGTGVAAGRAGARPSSNTAWTSNIADPCFKLYRLYCFQESE